MNRESAANVARLGGQALSLLSIVRQLRAARVDHDGLRILDAAINALAIITAVLIIVREIRERGGDAVAAVEDATL